MGLRSQDGGRYGLAGKDARRILAGAWIAEKALRSAFRLFANAVGLRAYLLPDMDEIARLARRHYDAELRGGEGHMEVGKAIQAFTEKKAHMVVSVKPFGCMPSSGVSDGVQSAVMSRLPEAIYCPVETTGDGEVGFQSRVLMFLFKARRKARAELDRALEERGLTLAEARRALGRRRRSPLHHPPHRSAGDRDGPGDEPMRRRSESPLALKTTGNRHVDSAGRIAAVRQGLEPPADGVTAEQSSD